MLADRGLQELFSFPHLSDGAIEACVNRMIERSFDGFSMRDQNGSAACVFFELENFKSEEQIGALTPLGTDELSSYSGNASYIPPLSGTWINGALASNSERERQVLYNSSFLTQDAIDTCIAEATDNGFDGFSARSQNGQTVCAYFNEYSFRSESELSLASCQDDNDTLTDGSALLPMRCSER